MAVLSRIAENRGIDNPKLHVQIIRNKLFRRIEDHRSSVAATRHHDHFVEPWLVKMNRAEHWLCYLIRLTQNKRAIGRRRGSECRTRASAITDATTITNASQLTPVEQCAYAILKGARRPKKETKHPIEKRALQLAKAVEAEWFTTLPKSGRPSGKWKRKPDAQRIDEQYFDALKPPLTISDVVSIAAPVIEGLAQCKITRRSEAFEALYRTVWIYSDEIARHTPITRDNMNINEKSVQQALSRVRSEIADLSTQLISGP